MNVLTILCYIITFTVESKHNRALQYETAILKKKSNCWEKKSKLSLSLSLQMYRYTIPYTNDII